MNLFQFRIYDSIHNITIIQLQIITNTLQIIIKY
jgi:hypothetical protein